MTAEQYTGLAIDEETDAVIGAALDPATDDATFTRPAIASEDGARLAWGMGRALARLTARDAQLEKQRAMLIGELDEARAKLSPQFTFLKDQLKAMALEHRESGEGEHLDIPGVGRWQTTKVPAGWDIKDPKAALADISLDETARALCVEDKPTLNNKALRKYLDDPMSEGVIVDGVERRPERISVSYTLNGAS